jgi:phosphoribosylglycinamide formyltransferase-1
VHFVNEVPEGGKIIMQRAVKNKENDTPEKLQKRVMEQAEWKILPQALEEVCFAIRKEK